MEKREQPEEMENQVEKEQKLQEPGEREREQETKQEPEERKPEQVEKQQKVQEPEERERETEKKQQKVQEPKEREGEQEQEREEYPNPPPKTISPPREMEVQRAKPISPPKLTPLTPLPRPNSKSKSPPLDSPPSEVEDDYKRPPVKDPTTPPPYAAACTVETVTSKMGTTSPEFNNQERVGGGNTGGGRTYMRSNTLSILKTSRRDSMVKRSLLASRICGFVFSMVSFSVLAADRDRGWALDSFYRYKEFRYCMGVNVIAFVYSGFQGYDIAYQLTSGNRKARLHLRYYLDFCVDQMLTYLLISASSSAAVRVDDWQSNWGKDEFPQMARASVALSFLAFVAFALGSLISGYRVFTHNSL